MKTCKTILYLTFLFISSAAIATPQIEVTGISSGEQVILPNSVTININVTDPNDPNVHFEARLNGDLYASGTTITDEKIYSLSVFALNRLGETAESDISFSIRKRPLLSVVPAVVEGTLSQINNRISITKKLYVASKASDNFNIRDVNAYSYRGWILDENGRIMNNSPLQILANTTKIVEPLQKQICYEEILPADGKYQRVASTANCTCGTVEEISTLGSLDAMSIIKARYKPALLGKNLLIQNGYAVMTFQGDFIPLTTGTPTFLEVEGIGYKSNNQKYDVYGKVPLSDASNPELAISVGGGVIEPGDGGVEIDPAPKCEWKTSITGGKKDKGKYESHDCGRFANGTRHADSTGLVAFGRLLDGDKIEAVNQCYNPVGFAPEMRQDQGVISDFQAKVYLVGSCEKPKINFIMTPRFTLNLYREENAAGVIGGVIDILANPSGKRAIASGAIALGERNEFGTTFSVGTKGLEIDYGVGGSTHNTMERSFFANEGASIQSSSVIFDGVVAGRTLMVARGTSGTNMYRNLIQGDLTKPNPAKAEIAGDASCDECDCKASFNFEF